MIWVVNIGNTTTTIANKNNIYCLETHSYDNSSDLMKFLKGFNINTTDTLYLASVVSHKNIFFEELFDNCIILTNQDFNEINTDDYVNSNLGIDRLIAMHAARNLLGDSFILYDLGTATTANIVVKKRFLGGAITSGVKTTLTALTQNTANLYDVTLKSDTGLIGTSTSESLLSGAIYATAIYIDGYSERVNQSLNLKLPVILIGGNSVFLDDKLKTSCHIEKNLIINYLVNKYCK